MGKKTHSAGWFFFSMLVFGAFHSFAWSPVATNDTYSTDEDKVLTVSAPGVLANDRDPDGQTLRAILVSNPSHGTLTLNQNGSFTYRPATNYNGGDSFTYKANDGSKNSGVATVTITVRPVNDPPIAKNDSYTTSLNTPLTIAAPGVLANDADVEGNALRAVRVSTPAHGSVVLNTNGSFVYSPTTGYLGNDSFTYKAVDSAGGTSGVATVTLKIRTALTNCVGEALPNPAYGATSGGHAVWLPGIGTNFVFTPVPGTFVQLADGTAILSGTVFSRTNSRNGFVVDVRLSGYKTTPPPDSPKKELSSSAYSENGGPIDTSTWVYYTNFTGTFTGVSNYAGAVLTIVRVGPAFQVGFGASGKNINFGASAWFNWTVVQQPASGPRLTTTGQGDFNIDLFTCDDGGEQCVTNAVPNPTYANSTRSHAIYLPGIVTDLIFTPAGRFRQNSNGTATLTGLATSRSNPRNAFQINVQLSGFTTNVSFGSPKKDLKSIAYIENGGPIDPSTWSYYTTVLGTFTGVSNYAGAVLKIARTGPAFQIGVGANGKNLHFGASSWFKWTVSHQPNSGSMSSGQGDFNLDIVDCPSGLALSCPAASGEVSFPFSSSLAVSGGTPPYLFAIIAGALPNGLVLNATNGNITGTPTVAGAFNFTARVTDGTGASALSVCSSGCISNNVCTITVTSTNRPPVALDDAYQTPADTTLTVPAPGVLANDFDPDGNPLTALLVSNPTRGSLSSFNANGSFVYVPNPGFTGLDVFTYRARDNMATSGVATVTILVVPSPVIVITPPANQTNCPGETATFSVTATGTALTYQWLRGTNILNGQTNSTLVLPNVSPAQAGMYCVIMRGADPVAVTNCALLVISQNVIVTVPPANQTVCSNETALFRVTATGTRLAYQWFFGATALGGQTSNVLVLSNVTTSLAGTYRVVVSGACGAPVTNSATLTVNQNVIVTTPPANQTICSNSTVVFTVGASGTALTYQWYFATNVLAGQTNSTLVLSNVTAAQVGTYRVIVSGDCGAPVTNSATLALSQNVIVTVPPANQAVCSNSTALFQVTAVGPALTYQWYFGATALGGATNSALALNNVTASQAGTYRVVVSGACGGPVTNSATLTVNQNVIVMVPPANQTVCSNGTAIFQITASGVELSYQWYFGSTPLAGQTSNVLVLNNVTVSQAGTYRVVVSGACGAPVTNSATLTVSQNVIVTVPPVNQNVCSNDTAVFQVTASGAGLTYQWYFGGTVLGGQTSSTLVLSNATPSQSGTYRVVVTGACGAPVTNSATLTLNENLIVTTPPANQTVCPNGTATFQISASGSALTYQWYFATNALAGQTNSTLVLSNVTAVQVGTYRVVVSGPCGGPVTNSATLTVSQNVIVTVPPANQTVCSNETANFQVTAIGAGLSYQWYFGTAPLAGQTSSTLVLNNAMPSQSGTYRVVVTGACGAPVTNSATLTVHANLIVATPPANQTVCPNSTATFQISASGSALTYQWYLAANALAGQTNSALVLSNVTVAQAGTYRVVVSGPCGGPVTNSATLMVSQNVIVTVPPANQTVCSNETAIFQVTAIGAGLSYQWYFGAAPLGGQTGSTLTISNAAPAQSGIYRVVVSGACGAPVTNSATLTVHAILIVATPPANQTVCPNGTATFQISASGSVLTYQWYLAANALAGQTNSALVLSNVTVAQAGTYRVVVSGPCGGPVTNSATLMVSQNVIVTVPPANQTVCSNETANFQVTAVGAGLSYQWYFGTAPLVGRTGSTLVLSNVAPSLAGTYRVIVSGTCGAPVTNSATLVVNQNLIVTTPPANQTVCPNGRAVFQVNASGTGLTYQWYFGTNALLSQTNSALVLDPVTASQAGTYSVVINGPCGGPVTHSATLTVSQNVIVTVPPANQTICSNETAVFQVTANGAGLSYQWYFGAAPIAGQTGSTLIRSNATPAQSGTYRVIVSGTCGGPVTNSATLTVNENLIVTLALTNQTACPNSSVIFRIVASGTGLAYQWSFGTNALPGQTGNMLVLSNLTAALAGTYQVIVNGPCGGPVTNSATLTVSENVIVTVPPANQVVCSNETAIFQVTANGAGLSYQWYFGAAPIAGQTGSTLILSNVVPAQSGTYRVVVSGACGAPVTNSATLTVNQNVIVTTPPANQSVCSGSTATFGVTATGSALTFQWYFNSAPLAGQTGISLVLSNVTTAEAGTYAVVVNGACGAPVTNSATLTVNQNVIVTVPPANQEVCPGETATFRVTAIGTALTYQWYRGPAATLLSGQTNSVLVLTNIGVLDSDIYSVVVRGVCGGPVTNSALLFVNINAIVIAPPTDQTSVVGSNATFTVTAGGSGLRFQWFFNGTLVGTNATLTLNNLTASQAGAYCVVVSGICGPRTTNCATLTLVNRPPVAVDDAYTTPEDVPLIVPAPGVLANDSDPDGDAITAMLVTNPTHGSVALNADGSFRYIPATNFAGVDVFTYKASDAAASSPPATVLIKVEPLNDRPIARDDNYTTRQNTTLTVLVPGVLVNDSDPDGDVLTAVLVAGTTNGAVTLLPDGSFIYVPSTNFLGVDYFTYRARDGALDSEVALVTITIADALQPPVVSIVSPTNGATFVAPAAFSVIADATDIDGVVTNVQIFAGTNRIGVFTNAPYLVPLTNLPAGTYTFIATAADNDGLSATSSPVTITVTPSPPVTALGPIVLNRQTGLFEQFVRVSNPTPQDFLNGVRVFVLLTPIASNTVWNATGMTNGLFYVDTLTPVLSGGFVDLLIQYYIPDNRVVPAVTLSAVPLPFGPAPLAAARVTSITRTPGNVTVEFTTAPRCLYYLQWSDDLVHWTTIPGVIRGTGGLMRCVESGNVPRRFYRTMVIR